MTPQFRYISFEQGNNARLARFQPRPGTRSAASNSSDESTPPVEKSRKSFVIAAAGPENNKSKQAKPLKTSVSKASGAEKASRKSSPKSGQAKISPKNEVKNSAKALKEKLPRNSATKTSPTFPSKGKSPLKKSLPHNSSAKTSPTYPSKQKLQANTKSPLKRVKEKSDKLADPPKKRDEVDSEEVTAADLGLELTDDGDGIEVELAKVEAEELQEGAVGELVKKEPEEVKEEDGDLVSNRDETSSSSFGNINTSGESNMKILQPKSEKHKKKKKSKEEKREKEEKKAEKRREKERRRTQERVKLLKEMSADSSLFGMENQNVFDVRHDD